MSEFTDLMEAEAETIAEAMRREKLGWRKEVDGRSNLKPWYSHLSAFQPGVKRALVGIDPGGDPSTPDDTVGRQYRELLEGDSYNAFLDESWATERRGRQVTHRPGEAPLQQAVRKVFRTLFLESNLEEEIRATACFNACPIRTGLGSKIPPHGRVWSLSEDWYKSVLEHIRPELLICIGNGDVSPWKLLNVDEQKPIKFAKSAHLKHGSAKLKGGQSIKVIGLPHLTGGRFSRPSLYDAIAAKRELLLGVQG